MTANTPIGEGWNRLPSVTPGGAAYFYARRSPLNGNRQWYMRDRATGRWEYHEERELPPGRTFGYAPVVRIPAPDR